MGFTPQQVAAMSPWQFTAALDGYAAANSVDDGKALSDQERDELAEWMGI